MTAEPRNGIAAGLLALVMLGATGPVSANDGKAPVAAQAHLPAGEHHGFQPLLNVIVTWLAANFDLPAAYEHPRIELLPPARLSAMRYGTVSLENRREVVAVYHDATRTILLSNAWTGRTPAEMSVLVHEMVHHLQNLGRHKFFCAEEREKLAYEAQEKWLGLFERSLESEFGIDKLTLKVTTACL